MTKEIEEPNKNNHFKCLIRVQNDVHNISKNDKFCFPILPIAFFKGMSIAGIPQADEHK